MLLTESYHFLAREELKKGEVYYFGQLWDGNGDGEEILNSGSIWMYDASADEYCLVSFKIVNEELMEPLNEEQLMEPLVLIESID